MTCVTSPSIFVNALRSGPFLGYVLLFTAARLRGSMGEEEEDLLYSFLRGGGLAGGVGRERRGRDKEGGGQGEEPGVEEELGGGKRRRGGGEGGRGGGEGG
ncbi:hypothetical protein FHG87_013058 [Trinorchestia longiramus]|nr:hypothetical protein FHG87_013058 [Trinorchestia longiramus]